MGAMPVVSIDELRKVYRVRERTGWVSSRWREITALDGVSLDVAPGEIFGLLGPNGAGKTTLIKCLTTLLLPTSGAMRVNGYDVLREPNAVRASLGCLLMGERGLYGKLTGRENLIYSGTLYSLPEDECRRRAGEWIERLGLAPVADRPVESYSSGQKMKVAFARALMPPAPLLVLDEPTNTLDVPSARELRALVRELNAQGRTVIYTTHQMPEAEELCSRVAIIDRGQVMACGTVPDLKRQVQGGGAIRVEGLISEAVLAAVRALPGVDQAALGQVNERQVLFILSAQPRRLLPELIHCLYAAGAQIEEIAPITVTLEDVFLSLTGRSLQEG